MKKKLLVFNLGGALLMPIDEVITIWCDAIRSIGVRLDTVKIFQRYNDNFQEVLIPELAKDGKWTPSQVDAVFSYAKKKFHDINTSTNLDLSKKLMELKAAGYSLGVVTDKNLRILMKGLNNIGCSSDLFDFVSTSDDGFKKPDSRVFAKMFKEYRPEEILFIGQDYHREFQLAKKVGIKFVAITSPVYPFSFWKSMFGGVDDIYPSVPQFIDDFLKK